MAKRPGKLANVSTASDEHNTSNNSTASYRDLEVQDFDSESSQESVLDQCADDEMTTSPYQNLRKEVRSCEKSYYSSKKSIRSSESFNTSYTSSETSFRDRSVNKKESSKSPKSDTSFDKSSLFRPPLHRINYRGASGGSPTSKVTRKHLHSFSNTSNKSRGFFDDLLENPLKIGCCSLCLVVFCALFYILFYSPYNNMPVNAGNLGERERIVQNFEEHFNKLREKFPQQSTRFWKIIKSTTKSVLKEKEPATPAVLLIVGNEAAYSTVDCIAEKFAETAAQSYDLKNIYKVVNGSNLSSYSPSDAKLYIDQALSHAFSSTKVGVIHDVDKIHGEAAMIFHSYCDNEFAPFKDVVLIFTVHLDSYEELHSDHQIESYLESRWQHELDKDKRSALIYSRIANSIAVVNPELESTLSKTCS